MACFYSLCVSPCLFLFPPHPHRTLPSTQTLISQISEKVGPFHFLSIYSSPIDGTLPSVGTSGLGQLPRARSSQACLPVGLCCLLFGPAGGQDQEWVGMPPCTACFCCLVPDKPCVCMSPQQGSPAGVFRWAWCMARSCTSPLCPGRASCLFQVEFRYSCGNCKSRSALCVPVGPSTTPSHLNSPSA